MTTPLVAILGQVQALLAPVAPNLTGKKDLLRADAAKRYVWVVVGAESVGTSAPGSNPRPLHDDRWSVEVHCWGATLDEALRLRQCLVTAVRQTVKGANYRLGTTQVNSDAEHNQDGHLVVVPLVLITPLARVDLALEADAVGLTGQATEAEIQPTPSAEEQPNQLYAPDGTVP